MRVGNKKPSMTVNKTVSVGKPSATENTSAHVATANRTVSGGASVHGKPLLSAAGPKQKH